MRKTAYVNVFKTNQNGGGLLGAVFELYFKENIIPPTYTFNDPYVTPTPEPSIEANSNTLQIPQPAEGNVSETKTYHYTYTYQAESAPSAEEKNWILPRTDNDYIYFRDYNEGTAAEWDDVENREKNRKYWLYTYLGDNDHGQILEIDYNHDYWFAAQFSGAGKQTVEYAVWERFVDDTVGDMNTIVWKIQPPDGYNKVRFCLYKNNNCVRTTKEIEFQLGDIFHKNGWGEIYREEYGNRCYFNVPVIKEANWSTYYNTGAPADKRMAAASSLKQADRYTPTQQKIIFHCNSHEVWHNIHIEFFRQQGENYVPVGQSFPGYMMEPYAYAGSDYRLNHFLTYELTIPVDATHFRVNNGIDLSSVKGSFSVESAGQSPYAYRSEITELFSSTNKNGRKNYGNYFRLNGDKADVDNISAVLLTTWDNYTQYGDKWNETYTADSVESDYDYIYFEKPDDWNDHVYAYFYGGGDLRRDNWQRACYSVWPGIAPAASDYTTDGGIQYHSDIYTYTYQNSLYGYGNTVPDAHIADAPESTFTDAGGKVVYKFRIPLGDRKNYSKVIFNDGLISKNGGHETGVITYSAGYLYKSNGSSAQHYENKPTVSYQQRGDRLCIKNTANWDDIHIIFYDEDGTQILQGGKGYIMKYSGQQDNKQYFSIPIPSAAAKFSLNTGCNSYSNSTGIQTYRKTPIYDILRKVDAGYADNTRADYTKDGMVFELTADGTNGILSRTSPDFLMSVDVQTHTEGTAQQDSQIDYEKRGDVLYIRNTAGWTIGQPDISGSGGGKIVFYDADHQPIRAAASNVSGNGTYTLIQTIEESAEQSEANTGSAGNSKEWYTIEIPRDAVSFRLTAPQPTGEYPVYPLVSSNTGTSDSRTTGGMYYETSGTDSLSLLWPTFHSNAPDTSDEIFSAEADNGQRGDTLYIVCADKSSWNHMTVTFYDADNVPIPNVNGDTAISAKELGTLSFASGGTAPIDGVSTSEADAAGTWFRAAIPSGAVSFTVTGEKAGVERTTQKAAIYELHPKLSRYRKEYTLGDMQYRIDDSTDISPIPMKLLYPIFTQDDVYTLEGHEDISTESGTTKIDETMISGYMNAAAVTAPAVSESAPENPLPVLYGTDTNNVTYEWKEGTAGDGKLRFDNTNLNWGTVYAYFYNGSSYVEHSWPGIPMEGSGILSVDVPDGAAHVIFNIGSDDDNYKQDEELNTINNRGKNMIFTPTYQTATDQYLYVRIAEVNALYGDANSGQIRAYFYNSSDDQNTTWLDSPIGDDFNEGGSFDYYASGSTQVTRSASYQPEDRYGMISVLNTSENGTAPEPITEGTADRNNFIYIDTAMEDPYIMFYSTHEGISGTEIGGAVNAANGLAKAGIRLKQMQNAASPYRIRLPKNACSFRVTDGGSNTPVGTAVNLYETDYDVTIQQGTDDITVTLPKFHHAGTTFTVSTDDVPVVTVNSLRSGFTAPTRKITDPLNPRTDIDYIYFTDTENWAVNNTMYAYYYGGADGEYAAWPGVRAEYAAVNTGTNAPTAYVDNSGIKVYLFQLPKESDGKYPYVIFNNGSLPDRKITEAVPILDKTGSYTGGMNYSASSVMSNNYGRNGTSADSALIPAYETECVQKTDEPTVICHTSGSNRYIFLVNNGTYQLIENDGTRYALDDMHVAFYDKDRRFIGTSAGYRPDKLLNQKYEGSDVYRIKVPSDAVFFEVNNGQTKGTGTENHYRTSEMKTITANGLYRFVKEGTQNSDYWDCGSDTAPVTTAALDKYPYFLELVNNIPMDDEETPDIQNYDVHLATVVTGEDGRQEKIIWLKRNKAGNEVDEEYLDHDLSDIWSEENPDAKVKEVRVKKWGSYYWLETEAPAGYKLSNEQYAFVIDAEKAEMAMFTTDIVDEIISGQVMLIKTAKEQVGDKTVGARLPGAKFRLVSADDPDSAITLAKKLNQSVYCYIPTDPEELALLIESGKYEMEDSALKEYNISDVVTGQYDTDKAPVTDTNGRIRIENLPWGNYYFEEIEAPSGYVPTDSYHTDENDVPQNNRLYFSVGQNNVLKTMTCADEMDPAYLRLYEHINEWRPSEWGNPNFIFKITQTGYYKNAADIEAIDSGKTFFVSLTVNDDEKRTDGLLTHVNPDYDYRVWYEEGTVEPEYEGVYHIDAEGRIRLEPGTYEITRVPVSRYEFVENTYKLDNEPDSVYEGDNRTEVEKMTVEIPAGRTAIVHYYDKVGYYDKSSKTDTNINRFYLLDENKQNVAVKGIRIEDYHQTGRTGENADTDAASDQLTVPLDRLKAYVVYLDGSERLMSETEKQALDITYLLSNNNGERLNDFAFSDGSVIVRNVSRHANNVYTLNAAYNGFQTKFDLVLERSSEISTVSTFSRKVLFCADYADGTIPENEHTNISWFNDVRNGENIRTAQYELTFVVQENEIVDIYHNGGSVKTDDTVTFASAVSKILTPTDDTFFTINEAYKDLYVFDSWFKISTDDVQSTDYASYNALASYIIAHSAEQTPIVLAAHLRKAE